jgi:MFS superfamily sulfate permease-like transporter
MKGAENIRAGLVSSGLPGVPVVDVAALMFFTSAIEVFSRIERRIDKVPSGAESSWEAPCGL